MKPRPETRIARLPLAAGDLLSGTRLVNLEEELERHHADCFAWAMTCCGRDRSEAEDVLQSSYLKVLDGHAVFGGRSTFRTWLFGVIRRTAGEHRRRRMLRGLWVGAALDEVEAADPAPDPAALVALSETSTRLLGALERLPRRQRELLHLVFYQDLTIQDAAAVIGVSLGTARTHFERGKKRLRGWLGAEDRP